MAKVSPGQIFNWPVSGGQSTHCQIKLWLIQSAILINTDESLIIETSKYINQTCAGHGRHALIWDKGRPAFSTFTPWPALALYSSDADVFQSMFPSLLRAEVGFGTRDGLLAAIFPYSDLFCVVDCSWPSRRPMSRLFEYYLAVK